VSQEDNAANAVDSQPADPANPVNEVLEELIPTTAPIETIEEPAAVVQPEVSALDSVQNAGSVTELQTALTAVELALNLTGYNALSAADQEQAAEALLNGASGEGFTDSAAVQQALNQAVAAQRDVAALRDAITAVNSADSAVQLQSALEVPYLGLVMLNYRQLSAEGKLAAAGAMLQAVPAAGFANRADIQQAFNAAIAAALQAEAE
jgi:hypothetical protein